MAGSSATSSCNTQIQRYFEGEFWGNTIVKIVKTEIESISTLWQFITSEFGTESEGRNYMIKQDLFQWDI